MPTKKKILMKHNKSYERCVFNQIESNEANICNVLFAHSAIFLSTLLIFCCWILAFCLNPMILSYSESSSVSTSVPEERSTSSLIKLVTTSVSTLLSTSFVFSTYFWIHYFCIFFFFFVCFL